MPGARDLSRGRRSRGAGALHRVERGAGESLAGTHRTQGPAAGCQGMGRQARQIAAVATLKPSNENAARGRRFFVASGDQPPPNLRCSIPMTRATASGLPWALTRLPVPDGVTLTVTVPFTVSLCLRWNMRRKKAPSDFFVTTVSTAT